MFAISITQKKKNNMTVKSGKVKRGENDTLIWCINNEKNNRHTNK